VDNLLLACSSLQPEIQPHIVIIGDGPAREELEKLSHQVYTDVEFVGQKHAIELEPYFIKADLFVLPGSGGLAIQEAMAHGLPVVVARGDGTQDDLVRSENGWQVPADDAQALTDVLIKALSNPAKLRQMGEASYRIVADEINVDKMVEVFSEAMTAVNKA
jgi:glycosyltransferase involved in cell wall biosynthesis